MKNRNPSQYFLGTLLIWLYLNTSASALSFFSLDLKPSSVLSSDIEIQLSANGELLQTIRFAAGDRAPHESQLNFEADSRQVYTATIIRPNSQGNSVYIATKENQTYFTRSIESSAHGSRLKVSNTDVAILSLRPERVISQVIRLNRIKNEQSSVHAFAVLAQYGSWSRLIEEADSEEANDLILAAVNGFERTATQIYSDARSAKDGKLYRSNIRRLRTELETVLAEKKLRERVEKTVPIIESQLKALNGTHQTNVKLLLELPNQ